MPSLVNKMRENISNWNKRNTHTGQKTIRACYSKESFIKLIAPDLKDVHKYSTIQYDRSVTNDFQELGIYYKAINNKEKICNSLTNFLLEMKKYRVLLRADKTTEDIPFWKTLAELKEEMLSALSQSSDIHRDLKKSEELIKTVSSLNIIENDEVENLNYLDLWIDTIFFYFYYAVTDELHSDMPFVNYPLKKDLEEYNNLVTLKYGTSGNPGLYQVYYLANKKNNLIALYECGEHEYYGNGPSKKVNYEAAYNYYKKTLECVGNHPLALWSIAYMEFEYLKNPSPCNEYRVGQIEDIIRTYGIEGLCKDILDKVGRAYMYSGASKGAAANLLGKIMEADESIFPNALKIGYYYKSARQYYKESADEGYVYGCNNFSRICMEELQFELNKENKNISVCYDKAINRKKYLEQSAELGEPWAANRYALLLIEGWGIEGKRIISKDIQRAYELFVYGESMGEVENNFWPLINLCNIFWLNGDESGNRQKINSDDLNNLIIPKVERALELIKDKTQILELVKIRKKAYEILEQLGDLSSKRRIINFITCKENCLIDEDIKDSILDERLAQYDSLKMDDNYWKTICVEKNLPIISVGVGNKSKVEELYRDEKNEDKVIFDLASITKFFLVYVYLYLESDEEIQKKYNFNLSINKRIKDYTSDCFSKISDLKICDLMSYNVNLQTIGRIDDYSEDKYDNAFKCLNGIEGNYSQKQIYSDMPMLVLGELLEIITSRSFGEWIDDLVIEKYNLKDTYWEYRKIEEHMDELVDYSNEYRLKANGTIEEISYEKGRVHDKKARILSDNGTRLCGNAGLFSSASDICTILKELLNENDAIKTNLLKIVLGNGWNQESSNNSFGYGCYRKYYDGKQSEVPSFMSPYTIIATGYTGCYFALDLLNECFIFIGANRLSNCISCADKLAVYKDEDGYISVGERKYKNTINYVYRRDYVRDQLALRSLLL